MEKFVSEHTVDEVEKIMLENQIPCQKVYSLKDYAKDPHWKNNPGEIKWGAPLIGENNEEEKNIGILEWQLRAGNAAPLHTITSPVEVSFAL